MGKVTPDILKAFRCAWEPVRASIVGRKLSPKDEFEALSDEGYATASEVGELFGVSGEEIILADLKADGKDE